MEGEEGMNEQEELPKLVDNMEQLHTVEKEVSIPTGEPIPRQASNSTIKYPRLGSLLSYEGQLYAVTKELNRNRFVIKWRSGP
jgi:hypothetical protein